MALIAVVGATVSPLRGDPVADPTTALSDELRSLLVQFVPSPLFEDNSHWGHQREVVRGLVWRGQGLRVHAEAQTSLKNDGLWWRVRVETPTLADSLVFQIRDLQKPSPERMQFTAFIAFDARIIYDRERWMAGVRTWAGSIEGRVRVKLTLRCEAVTRLETTGKLLPDAVFRLHVLESDFGYENLRIEHVAGFGGDLAKILGEAIHSGIRQWHPSIERNLIAKANAAILKGGDTKEVRVSLSKLFSR
jgi:hypothetical protein